MVDLKGDCGALASISSCPSPKCSDLGLLLVGMDDLYGMAPKRVVSICWSLILGSRWKTHWKLVRGGNSRTPFMQSTEMRVVERKGTGPGGVSYPKSTYILPRPRFGWGRGVR